MFTLIAATLLFLSSVTAKAAVRIPCPQLTEKQHHTTTINPQSTGEHSYEISSCTFGSSFRNSIPGATWSIDITRPPNSIRQTRLNLTGITLLSPAGYNVTNALVIEIPAKGVDLVVSDVHVNQWLFFIRDIDTQQQQQLNHVDRRVGVANVATRRRSPVWSPLSAEEKLAAAEASFEHALPSQHRPSASASPGAAPSAVDISRSSFTRYQQASQWLLGTNPEIFTRASGSGADSVWSVFSLGATYLGGNFSVTNCEFVVADRTWKNRTKDNVPGLVLPFGLTSGGATVGVSEAIRIADNTFTVVSSAPATMDIVDELAAVSVRTPLTLHGRFEVQRNHIGVTGNTVHGISGVSLENFTASATASVQITENVITVESNSPGALAASCVAVLSGSYFGGSRWNASHNTLTVATGGGAVFAMLFAGQVVIDAGAAFVAAAHSALTAGTIGNASTATAAGIGAFGPIVARNNATLSVTENAVNVTGMAAEVLDGSRGAAVLLDGGLVLESSSRAVITANQLALAGTAAITTGLHLFQKKLSGGSVLRVIDNTIGLDCVGEVCAAFTGDEYGLVSLADGSRAHYDTNEISLSGSAAVMGGWINPSFSRLLGSSSVTVVGGSVRARSTAEHTVVVVTQLRHPLVTCSGSVLSIQNVTLEKEASPELPETCGNETFVVDACPMMRSVPITSRGGVSSLNVQPMEAFSGWGHLSVPVNQPVSMHDLVQPVNPDSLMPCGSDSRPCPPSNCNVDPRADVVCSQMSQQQLQQFFYSVLATGNQSASIALNTAVCAKSRDAAFAAGFGGDPKVELSCGAGGNVTVVTADGKYLLYTFPEGENDWHHGVRMQCSPCQPLGTPLANPLPLSMIALGAMKTVVITIALFLFTYYCDGCAGRIVRFYARAVTLLGNLRGGAVADHMQSVIYSKALPRRVSIELVESRLQALLDGKKPSRGFTLFCSEHVFVGNIPREGVVVEEGSSFHTKTRIQRLHRDYLLVSSSPDGPQHLVDEHDMNVSLQTQQPPEDDNVIPPLSSGSNSVKHFLEEVFRPNASQLARESSSRFSEHGPPPEVRESEEELSQVALLSPSAHQSSNSLRISTGREHSRSARSTDSNSSKSDSDESSAESEGSHTTPQDALDKSLRLVKEAVQQYPSQWESARLESRFVVDAMTPMRSWVFATVIYNVVLFISAIATAAHTDTFPAGYVWHRVQLAYFIYCNSTSSATMIAHIVLRRMVVDGDSAGFLKVLKINLFFLMPALLMYCLLGFFSYIWVLGPILFVGFGCEVFAHANSLRPTSRLVRLAVHAVARFVFLCSVMIVFSASFNYAMLLIWKVRFASVSYIDVIPRDFDARSLACTLNHSTDHLSHFLSAMAPLVSIFS